MTLTDKQLKERRWAHANGLTLELLDEFERVCTWLETQRYHATYNHISDVMLDDYRTSRLRRYVRVLYWRTGHGWSKRKDWRERLAELRAELQPPPSADDGWISVDEALPETAEEVEIFNRGKKELGRYANGTWHPTWATLAPTHWRKRPAPAEEVPNDAD